MAKCLIEHGIFFFLEFQGFSSVQEIWFTILVCVLFIDDSRNLQRGIVAAVALLLFLTSVRNNLWSSAEFSVPFIYDWSLCFCNSIVHVGFC